MLTTAERRHRRSDDPQVAMHYQLEQSRAAAGLEAMVLADEDGFCVAAAGDPDVCAEIAAQLATLGSRTGQFEGVLFGPDRRWDVHMRTFHIHGIELYMCAVGTRAGTAPIARSIGGASRILT